MLRFESSRLVAQAIKLTSVERPLLTRYAVAVLLAAGCVALAWSGRLAPGTEGRLVMSLLVVVFSSWFGGLGPGLLATALLDAALLAEDRSVTPAFVLRHLGFLFAGVATSVFGEVLHEARRQQLNGERRSERLAELQAQLEGVAAGANESLRVPQLAEIVVVQGCALLGASAGRLAILDESGAGLRTLHALGYPADLDVQVIDMASDEPLAEAVRTGRPVMLESRRDSDVRYPHLATVRDRTGTEAVAALPLRVQGRMLGGIGFSFREMRRFKASRLPLMQALAYQAALALDSARRYQREQALRAEAEALGERHRFLAAANACLASSLDYVANLREMARLAVPVLADACLLHVRDEGGGSSLLAAFHAEPGRSAALEELGRRQTGGDRKPQGFWRAFHSGQPELLSHDAAARWRERAGDGRDRELVARLDPRSSLVVPLLSRERCLGTITLLASPRARALTPDDLDLVVNLAARAAGTIENALLFDKTQRLNRVKDEFLSLLSHELRTPLGSIVMWLELLKLEKLETGASRAAEMIERGARQLRELIDQLLDVSGIAAGSLAIEKQSMTLAGLLESVVEAATPAAAVRGIRLESSIDGSLSAFWGDPGRLRQAIAGLVENAIKFSPDGGQVAVRLERREDRARLEIRDVGVGIPAEVLPLLFERFRRADTKSTRTHGGLGLGLAIAKYVVERHEGTIRAESEGDGKGSLFTIELLLRTPPGPSAAAGTQPRQKHALGTLRVLLVDDHDDTLRGLALGLAAEGADVTPVSSAREALAALPRVRPHVVVSDLAMPEKDGYTLITEIRQLGAEDGGRVPAVAVSAYASAEDRRRALRAGFQEHLAKPVQIGELVATLERLAHRDQPRDRERTAGS
jgi:signal transduction histidine kinase/ActR/RegA family two-component response regulator